MKQKKYSEGMRTFLTAYTDGSFDESPSIKAKTLQDAQSICRSDCKVIGAVGRVIFYTDLEDVYMESVMFSKN